MEGKITILPQKSVIKASPSFRLHFPPCDRRFGSLRSTAVAATITILGSGSAGNCAFIETPRLRLLIDAGFSGKQIAMRLASIGRKLEEVSAVLLTHEHHDHTQGLPVLCKRYEIPVYANRLTAEAVQEEMPELKQWRVFQTGHAFELGDVLVESFTVPHDAHDPVGFLLRHECGNVGVLTDLGHCTRLVLERVRPANVLMLETNHDPRMLQDASRPWSLKQRILSRFGHLSNEAAAEVVTQLASGGLRHIFLGHLSRECNRPELAHRAVTAALHNADARHVRVHVTSQDAPNPTLHVGAAPDAPAQSCGAVGGFDSLPEARRSPNIAVAEQSTATVRNKTAVA
ncbi:MAG: MBL fold metallo-hydrolase [Verrucomicrobia bacterium]|nr:MBL fold metallo-hydrolase [Verrucomicrobiota bacterium]